MGKVTKPVVVEPGILAKIGKVVLQILNSIVAGFRSFANTLKSLCCCSQLKSVNTKLDRKVSSKVTAKEPPKNSSVIAQDGEVGFEEDIDFAKKLSLTDCAKQEKPVFSLVRLLFRQDYHFEDLPCAGAFSLILDDKDLPYKNPEVKTLQNVFEVDIKQYVKIKNIESFVKFCDEIGDFIYLNKTQAEVERAQEQIELARKWYKTELEVLRNRNRDVGSHPLSWPQDSSMVTQQAWRNIYIKYKSAFSDEHSEDDTLGMTAMELLFNNATHISSQALFDANLMDVPGDGNCLLHAVYRSVNSQDQSVFRDIKSSAELRPVLMSYLMNKLSEMKSAGCVITGSNNLCLLDIALEIAMDVIVQIGDRKNKQYYLENVLNFSEEEFLQMFNYLLALKTTGDIVLKEEDFNILDRLLLCCAGDKSLYFESSILRLLSIAFDIPVVVFRSDLNSLLRDEDEWKIITMTDEQLLAAMSRPALTINPLKLINRRPVASIAYLHNHYNALVKLD